jgi:hypothetical protein
LARTPLDEAQSAVALYLLHNAAALFDRTQFDQSPGVNAAEHRFAALSTVARQSWLRPHYGRLRLGLVRLGDVP